MAKDYDGTIREHAERISAMEATQKSIERQLTSGLGRLDAWNTHHEAMDNDRFERQVEQMNEQMTLLSEIKAMAGELRGVSEEDFKRLKESVDSLNLTRAGQGGWWAFLEKFGGVLLIVLGSILTGLILHWLGLRR